MPLRGMNAVITGAAGGIGSACARHFLNAGARVVISDINLKALQQTLESLNAQENRLWSVQCDVSRSQQCEALVKQSEQLFGAPLDIFLFNAGRPFSGGLMEAQEQDIRDVVDVNVTGSIFSAQAALRSLVRGRTPSLLFTGSLQSVSGRAQRSVYTASKHAVAGLVKSLALEMGPHGVRVNGIAPTAIDTPFLRQAYARVGIEIECGLRRAAEELPLGQIPTTDDFAQAAVFLASSAARSVTGHMMMIDCGASAGKFSSPSR